MFELKKRGGKKSGPDAEANAQDEQRFIQAEGKLLCLELKGLLGHYDAGEMG